MRELSALSMKLQAPVIFAQDAIGVIPETHPFFAGHFQHYRSYPLCVEALKRTDLVLGVGLRAGTAELAELKERAPEKNLILVGFDDAPNSRYQGDDQRVADPKLFLTALLERLGSYQRPRDEALHQADGRRQGRRAHEPRGPQRAAPERQSDPSGHTDGRDERGPRRQRGGGERRRQLPDVGAHLSPHRHARVVHAVRRLERHELRPADGHRRQDGISRSATWWRSPGTALSS